MKDLSLMVFLITISVNAISQNNTFPTSGNVGIGTTTPTDKLSVIGNISVPLNYSIGFGQSDRFTYDSKSIGNYSLGWYNDSQNSGGPWSYYAASTGIKFFTQAQPRMAINSVGNVGIGTTSPRGKFDVDGAGDIYLSDDPNAGTTQSLFLPGHIYISPYNGGNVSYFQARRLDNSGTTAMQFRTTSAGNLVEAMFIGGNGNIGIGTTVPNHKFEITNNSGTPELALRGAFDSKMIFEAGDGSQRFTVWSDTDAFTSNDVLRFSAAGAANIFNIKGNGNVGIGTINPDTKLAVKGTIHAEEVKVDLNVPVPDYVFEKNYNLPSLAEVENYINQHKHLPEVPAAKEMEKNGVKLGEMNILLLKKVEELTLYLLEQNKMNQEQAKEIEKLKHQLLTLHKE